MLQKSCKNCQNQQDFRWEEALKHFLLLHDFNSIANKYEKKNREILPFLLCWSAEVAGLNPTPP